MNTAALKTFAPALRTQLMAAVALKLDFVLSAKTPDYLTTFAPQVAALRTLAASDRSELIERVAYTWFNRFAALRFMDARGWHPFRARVITAAGASETQPELLKVTRAGTLPEDLRAHTDPARLNHLLDGRIPSSDAQGEVYRHLVLAACRYYHALLPNVFEHLDDETELLLPDDLLTAHSVVHGFRTEISDDDCGDGQRANVEILGWLYQFYISERKGEVMGRKSAVPTEDIPAVTQLFTPHWIVRYLLENSLGRLWLLNHPNSGLREHMPYYIEGEPETAFLKITRPEELRLCDPAVGSGHMLTYAFDLLALIYEEEGYAPTEIPALILRHNLHGLEICPRAAQLAELALVFKAREKSRRFFARENVVQPHIVALQNVRLEDAELREYMSALNLGELFDAPMLQLLHQFESATTFGSLIQPCLDDDAIAFVRGAIETRDLRGQLFLRATHLKVVRILEQAAALGKRYEVVVANPPYMGGGTMNATLKAFARERYADSKADLFAMFVERTTASCVPRGLIAMVTMQTWMFLPTFETFRKRILRDSPPSTLVQIGYNSFPEMNSKIAQACAFVLSNATDSAVGTYVSLTDAPQSANKNTVFLQKLKNREVFRVAASEFGNISGSPIAYWLSKRAVDIFASAKAVKDVFSVSPGIRTGKDELFLRLWFEVSRRNTQFGLTSAADMKPTVRWFPLNKGGLFRKWYGNIEHVINLYDDAVDIRTKSPDYRLRDKSWYFLPYVTWSRISSSDVAFRVVDNGILFSDAAPGIFAGERCVEVAQLLNSKLGNHFLAAINPTLNYQKQDIETVPFMSGTIDAPNDEMVQIARRDWDNFETSWDFHDQPLLRPGLKGATLEASWRNWESHSTTAVRRMQELETENNRIFIAAYGLGGELQPEVPEEHITLARAEARRDVAAFLSYAVGCMMGRYSLDCPGLIMASAGDTFREFLATVGRAPDVLAFAPDDDGIIPVVDGEWFEDDIVARTREFLRATFGEATLRENLRFIEESLGKDLRKYFLADFYKDHLQTYKKRPIYWMVQSPSKGFSALLYLHRYTRDTMNVVLNRYLREFQTKARNRLPHLAQAQANGTTARAKTEARKEAERLAKTLVECEEWERQTILPLAQQRIELDLDDGVKVNYLKFGDALAPIPGLAAAED